MEWLEGETLEDRVARGPLRISETLQLGRRVAEALAAAHKHGVVHRDIKPANVFLPAGDPSQAKVLDFGIARRLFDPQQNLRLTSANAALGTPLYMAPEQARGASNVDGRADIFALGCVLFECLAGQPPFAGASPTAVMAKICLDDSVDVARQRPETPPDLVALIAHMLAKDPDQRPARADAVARALGAITGQFISRDTASDPERSTAPARPPRLWWPPASNGCWRPSWFHDRNLAQPGRPHSIPAEPPTWPESWPSDSPILS
jgi:serine/threonine protein kinase